MVKKKTKTLAKKPSKVSVSKVEKKDGVEIEKEKGTDVPLDAPRLLQKDNLIGVNMGVTLNMGNYESMRIDCCASNSLKEDETIEEGLKKLAERVKGVLEEEVAKEKI